VTCNEFHRIPLKGNAVYCEASHLLLTMLVSRPVTQLNIRRKLSQGVGPDYHSKLTQCVLNMGTPE
jgi:hypothetical protein